MNLKTGSDFMLRTVVILDMLKSKFGSDYKASEAMDKPANYLCTIRSKKGILSDEMGLKAAKLLDFPADYILLSLAAERADNSETMQEIKRLAEQHAPKDNAKTTQKKKKAS